MLVNTLIWVYIEKKQVRLREIQNIQFKDKNNSSKCIVDNKMFSERDKNIKGRSTLKLWKGTCTLMAKLYPYSSKLVMWGVLKKFLLLKSNKKSFYKYDPSSQAYPLLAADFHTFFLFFRSFNISGGRISGLIQLRSSWPHLQGSWSWSQRYRACWKKLYMPDQL